jgi:hypothetical protein
LEHKFGHAAGSADLQGDRVCAPTGRFETVSTDIPDFIGAPQQSYAGLISTTPLVRSAN